MERQCDFAGTPRPVGEDGFAVEDDGDSWDPTDWFLSGSEDE